jgi:hypothetical protein
MIRFRSSIPYSAGVPSGGTKRHPGGTNERASRVAQPKANTGASFFREQPRPVAIPVEVW